jgi:putative DNA primase/helicase
MTHELLSFQNRYAKTGVIQTLSFEQMYLAFKKNVIKTKETVEEYQKGDREFKLKAKDKGAFIAGTSEGNTRDALSILSRNMITLDMDYCPSNILEIIRNKQDITKELNFRFFVYSTHSHTPEKPRYRLIVPLMSSITVEKYEPIARAIAGIIGMENFDATTFQTNRIMYFPTVSIDGEYVCEEFGMDEWNDLNPDDMLDRYLDYLNIAEFQKPLYIEGLKVDKIEDGKAKDSRKTKYRIVNAFNTEYTIQQAIETFLKEQYEKGKTANRFTFINGQSKDGLVILNDQYAYSHHGTDPAQGRLLNAFDIVRIHFYGKKDIEKTDQQEYDQYDKNTSYSDMVDYIRANLPNVMKHMPEIEKLKKNEREFTTNQAETEINSVEAGDWKLTLDYTGSEKDRHPKSNARNIKIIFENDPYFKGLFYNDSLKDAICFDRTPDWNKEKGKGDLVTDEDDSEIRVYLNSIYQIAGKDLIYDSVVHQSSKVRRHPIKTFFATLPDWDGVPRMETVICDLYDIPHNAYYKEASKAWWVGIVQRIMRPGSKFDMMLVICGEQGIGKSQLGKSVATLYWKGDMTKIDSQPNFYGDDELPFDKKDAYEQLNGIMIYELPEFEKYYKKSDTSTIKSFLSKTSDKFRKSYGRRVAEYRRQCVFIATTNDMRPLRDRTGNRRFLPFYARLPKNTSRLYNPKYWNEEVRNQCLAEAIYHFDKGFNPMTSFSDEAKRIWDELNEKATAENDSFPIVEMYVNNRFPTNYFRLNLMDMKKYYPQEIGEDFFGKTIYREDRTEFSLKEIYCVAFNRDIAQTPEYVMREQIESALDKLGFIKQGYRKSQGLFGQQFVYKKERNLEEVSEKTPIIIGEEISDEDLPF